MKFLIFLAFISVLFLLQSCNNPKLKDRAGWCNESESYFVPDELVDVDDDDVDTAEGKKKGNGNGKGKSKKVFVCHIPPGNHFNAHTIWISENALKAHLAHGDVLGKCEEVLPGDSDDPDGDDPQGGDQDDY